MEDKREFLETKARQARELALTVIASFGNGHVGGSMSIMDALAVLFYDAMRLDDQDPDSVSYTHLTLPTSIVV